MNIKSFCVIICFILMLLSCDHGIEPPEAIKTKTGLSGTIYYSNWDSAGYTERLKIVFFTEFPPQNIVEEVTTGRAKTYPVDLSTSLPLNEDSTSYEMLLAPGEYKYISVAQQFGPDLFSEWRSVGQYNEVSGDSLPSTVTVLQDTVLPHINIFVDFANLPVQYIEAP